MKLYKLLNMEDTSLETNSKIPSTDENWDKRVLGSSDEHTVELSKEDTILTENAIKCSIRVSLKDKVFNYLIDKSKKTPYFHIKDYMNRFWLVPYKKLTKVSLISKPISWVFQKFDKAIRIHEILRSDIDRAFHDHPWSYTTLILRGGYFEVRPVYDNNGWYIGYSKVWYGPGSILRRKATDYHRLVVPQGRTCWTLFITGKMIQHWGFMPNPQTREKIYWRDYLGDYTNTNNSEGEGKP